jgi:hypothetical protein
MSTTVCTLRRGALLTLAMGFFPACGFAQARAMTDTTDYIIDITDEWGRGDARLGDLRRKQLGREDIELRFWGGYGLGGTRGIVLRRTKGRWTAWRVDVRRCQVYLPIPVGDTLSEASTVKYQVEARRRCDDPPQDSLGSASVIESDTLDVFPAIVPANLGHVWRRLTKAGIRTLPTRIERNWIMMDGHTYVTQLRVGPEYRASRIEYVRRPEAPADRTVQVIDSILTREIGWEPAADSVVLERSLCYGSCPAYRLSLTRRGRVRFESRNRGDTSAVVVDSVAPYVLSQIVSRAQRMNFSEYPEWIERDSKLCPSLATDLPTITIALFGEQAKRVVYYTGCYESPDRMAVAPALAKLSELAAAIDSLTGSSRWVRPSRFP